MVPVDIGMPNMSCRIFCVLSMLTIAYCVSRVDIAFMLLSYCIVEVSSGGKGGVFIVWQFGQVFVIWLCCVVLVCICMSIL